MTPKNTFILILAVNLLVGCGRKPSYSGLQAPAQSGPESVLTNQGHNSGNEPTATEGTNSSGGGTGIDGKVFESYSVNPTSLPAYTKFIKPLLENIKRSSYNFIQYENIFKSKPFYIAPVALKKLGKDDLGVSFFKSDTQQIARQSLKEIWIDKDIFDSMEEKDQAELLVHEFIMSMYFYKFISFEEICKVSSYVGGIWGEKHEECTEETVNFFDTKMPAERPRSLNQADNENIRYVTDWLLKNAKSQISELDFVKILNFKNFDKLLFNPRTYEPERKSPEDIPTSVKDLLTAINATKLTNQMPDTCIVSPDGDEVPCMIEFSETTIKNLGRDLPALLITVKSKDTVIATAIMKVSEEAFGRLGTESLKLDGDFDEDGKPIYSIWITDWRSKINVGDRVYNGKIIFRKSEENNRQLTIESLVFKTGVISSVNKGSSPPCNAITPKNKSLENGFVMYKNGTKLSEKLWADQKDMFTNELPQRIHCDSSNVD